MKIVMLCVFIMLAGCSNDDLNYHAESAHVSIDGKSKLSQADAKAAGAVNQVVLDSVDK